MVLTPANVRFNPLTPRSIRIDRAGNPCWAGYQQVGMKRQGKRSVPNCVPVQQKAQKDSETDGKKYTKVVTNPETGRKNKVRYGAKGYRIAPGTPKGDRYCARSFGDMKSHSKDCSGADRNTPLCLSRAKWACSGKTSRKSSAPARKDNFIQHYAPVQLQPPNKRDWNPNS